MSETPKDFRSAWKKLRREVRLLMVSVFLTKAVDLVHPEDPGALALLEGIAKYCRTDGNV